MKGSTKTYAPQTSLSLSFECLKCIFTLVQCPHAHAVWVASAPAQPSVPSTSQHARSTANTGKSAALLATGQQWPRSLNANLFGNDRATAVQRRPGVGLAAARGRAARRPSCAAASAVYRSTRGLGSAVDSGHRTGDPHSGARQALCARCRPPAAAGLGAGAVRALCAGLCWPQCFASPCKAYRILLHLRGLLINCQPILPSSGVQAMLAAALLGSSERPLAGLPEALQAACEAIPGLPSLPADCVGTAPPGCLAAAGSGSGGSPSVFDLMFQLSRYSTAGGSCPAIQSAPATSPGPGPSHSHSRSTGTAEGTAIQRPAAAFQPAGAGSAAELWVRWGKTAREWCAFRGQAVGESPAQRLPSARCSCGHRGLGLLYCPHLAEAYRTFLAGSTPSTGRACPRPAAVINLPALEAAWSEVGSVVRLAAWRSSPSPSCVAACPHLTPCLQHRLYARGIGCSQMRAFLRAQGASAGTSFQTFPSLSVLRLPEQSSHHQPYCPALPAPCRCLRSSWLPCCWPPLCTQGPAASWWRASAWLWLTGTCWALQALPR